ncbi:MAG: hypothetical protein SFV18_10030 [Bryobacteraceae bacterium]|nr:hypothetical protein [Bryobacteraceae bacterium]
MSRLAILTIAALLAGCSNAPKEPTAAEAPKPAKKYPAPVDETMRFPAKNRVSVRIDPEHTLGKDLLPPGNVAEYKDGAVTWRLFLVKTASGEAAALLLFDLKSTFASFKFVPHFGGYYGLDGLTPVFAFQKGPYLAGVVGLLEKDADMIARDFAARLN